MCGGGGAHCATHLGHQTQTLTRRHHGLVAEHDNAPAGEGEGGTLAPAAPSSRRWLGPLLLPLSLPSLEPVHASGDTTRAMGRHATVAMSPLKVVEQASWVVTSMPDTTCTAVQFQSSADMVTAMLRVAPLVPGAVAGRVPAPEDAEGLLLGVRVPEVAADVLRRSSVG